MKIEQFVAKRYLISKHKINFITIISFLSVAGITIGVAALIVVLSVFNGFGSLVTSLLISFDPDLRVEIISTEGEQNNLVKILSETKGIKNYSPFVQGKVLVYRSNLTEVVNLKGINEDDATNIYGIRANILFGKYALHTRNDFPAIIMGLNLADRLQVLIGDTLTIISPAGIEEAVMQLTLPITGQFIVSGIYSSGNNEYDRSFIFCPLSSAQRLLGYDENIQGMDISTGGPDNADYVKSLLSDKLDKNIYSINTWYDFHRDLYSVMQIERWAAYIILCLIIAVATFNVLGSLSMSVIEKKRDIGILSAMGVSERSILKIFMFEGLLIGLIGTIAGMLLGYLVCFLQISYNIYPLDPTQYKINSLPVELRISDFFVISGASMLLAFIASLIPAKRAARINIIEAIKWE